MDKRGVAESIDLPEAEFSYIGRPWETFTGRWAAIREAFLEEHARSWGKPKKFGEAAPFTLLDVGSNNGYFSLQTAAAFPESTVIGIEGSVGVGNGSVGTSRCDWQALSKTDAVRTHLRWIRKLQLENCVVAPEVWDYDSVRSLVESGLCVDAMLSLSVVHHIDNHSADKQKMPAKGPMRLKATMDLLSDLLKLAWAHVIELPDRPWLDHVHEAFEGNPQAILEAVCKRTGFQWEMRKIYENAWIGHRELWFLRRLGQKPQPGMPIGLEAMIPFFPTRLPSADPEFEAWMRENAAVIDATPRPLRDRRQRRIDTAKIINTKDSVALTSEPKFLNDVMLGQWSNQHGDDIEVLPSTAEEPRAWASYASRGRHPITWKADEDSMEGLGSWILTNHGGVFHLEAASTRTLVWTRHGSDPFTTSWERNSERTR